MSSFLDRRIVGCLFALCSAACAGEEKPPFFLPVGDGGSADGSVNMGHVIGTDDPPDDFVSQWATLGDPDQICTGTSFSCGIRPDGRAVCWGLNEQGQSSPPENEVFTRIHCGDNHACGITDDARAVCWGAGKDPKLSAGGELGQSAVPPDLKFKEISCGAAHTCAITDEDNLVCWGAGAKGDPNGTSPHLSQALPPGGKFRSVSAGEAHTCAITLGSAQIECWGGFGDAGPSGDCFPPRSYACGQVSAPPGSFRSVSSGLAHTCALRTNGEMVCWGAGTTADDCDPTASDAVHYACGQSIPLTGQFVRIEAGHQHTCVIDARWNVQCIGWDNGGSTMLSADLLYSQVSAGHDHTCAVRRNGIVVCVGGTGHGESKPPQGFPGEL